MEHQGLDLRQEASQARPWASPSWNTNGVSDTGSPTAKRLGLDDWQAIVRRYNSGLDPQSVRFRTAVLLLASVDIGQNIDTLARRTGYDRPFVARAARRLIDNGVWADGKTVADWSAGGEASGSFWNDVAVAEGRACRRRTEAGSVEWAPAGYWNKSYDYTAAAGLPQALYHDAGPRPEATIPLADDLAKGAAADSTPEPAVPTSPPPSAGKESAPASSSSSLEEIFSDAVWIR
jgi:hypothetical protein